MEALTFALLAVWLVVPLISAPLYWKVIVNILGRMRILKQNLYAQMVGRDYVVQGIFGLTLTVLFVAATILNLVAPATFATTLVAFALLFTIPFMSLAHAVYLYRRVVGGKARATG